MHAPAAPHVLLALVSLSAFPGTGSGQPSWAAPGLVPEVSMQTSASDCIRGLVTQEETRAAISVVRRLTGLTWEQLARVFGVARRSLHFWANGKPMNRSNEERVHRLLSAIRQADRGSAELNRAMLMDDLDGVIPIDLLTQRRYDEFLLLVGKSPGRKRLTLRPLSQETKDARRPPPPDRLVDALQDPVDVKPGRGRAARTVKQTRRDRDGHGRE